MNKAFKFTVLLLLFAAVSAFSSTTQYKAPTKVSPLKTEIAPCVTGLTVTPHPTLAGTFIFNWDLGAGGPWTITIYDMTTGQPVVINGMTGVNSWTQGGFIAGHTYRVAVNAINCTTTAATLVFTA